MRCGVCGKGRVPDILLTSVEPPPQVIFLPLVFLLLYKSNKLIRWVGPAEIGPEIALLFYLQKNHETLPLNIAQCKLF